jgi:hypothetical protein
MGGERLSEIPDVSVMIGANSMILMSLSPKEIEGILPNEDISLISIRYERYQSYLDIYRAIPASTPLIVFNLAPRTQELVSAQEMMAAFLVGTPLASLTAEYKLEFPALYQILQNRSQGRAAQSGLRALCNTERCQALQQR